MNNASMDAQTKVGGCTGGFADNVDMVEQTPATPSTAVRPADSASKVVEPNAGGTSATPGVVTPVAVPSNPWK